MPELNIDQFDPTTAELMEIAQEAQAVNRDCSMKDIKTMRIKLRDVRVRITKKGKEMRADALAFQKTVIAKEEELIAIIEPEEERLKAIEDEVAAQKERDRRLEILPQRRDALKDIADPTDEELLEMDDDQYVAYRNGKIEEKNQAESKRLADERAKLDAEKAEIKRQQDLKEAEERGRKEAQERSEREAKEKIDREAREKADTERKEREEKEKLEREKKYREWRSSLGWTPETKHEFEERKIGNIVEVWKKVGAFSIKQ